MIIIDKLFDYDVAEDRLVICSNALKDGRKMVLFPILNIAYLPSKKTIESNKIETTEDYLEYGQGLYDALLQGIKEVSPYDYVKINSCSTLLRLKKNDKVIYTGYVQEIIACDIILYLYLIAFINLICCIAFNIHWISISIFMLLFTLLLELCGIFWKYKQYRKRHSRRGVAKRCKLLIEDPNESMEDVVKLQQDIPKRKVFNRIRSTFTFTTKKRTYVLQFTLKNPWWIPHHDPEYNNGDINLWGWLFVYFGYINEKKKED